MSTDVVAYQSASLNDRWTYAKTLAAAGSLIPRGLRDGNEPNVGKILLVMETGSMLGLHPMASLQSIDVVEGRATLSARLMSALITKAGHRISITKTGSIPGGDYAVRVVGVRSDTRDEFVAEWDIARAMRAGLVQSYARVGANGPFVVRARSKEDKPLPWEAYAESMPVWRAVSEVGREGFSDVLFGLYSTEEMTDGGIPIAQPVEAPAEPTEPWRELIDAAETRADLDAIKERMSAKGEVTDKLKAAWLARAGFLDREANTVDAEIVDDHTADETPAEGAPLPSPSAPASPDAPSVGEETQEEYEARIAAEFDAAMEEGDPDA